MKAANLVFAAGSKQDPESVPQAAGAGFVSDSPDAHSVTEAVCLDLPADAPQDSSTGPPYLRNRPATQASVVGLSRCGWL